MHPIIEKTFGGLSPSYYFRHLFFGLLVAASYVLVLEYFVARSHHSFPIMIWVFLWLYVAICTLFYPYSRFVYESIVNFIVGDNVFFVNAGIMLFIKLITMILCWGFSIFIAPFGLAYLYYHHSKQ